MATIRLVNKKLFSCKFSKKINNLISVTSFQGNGLEAGFLTLLRVNADSGTLIEERTIEWPRGLTDCCWIDDNVISGASDGTIQIFNVSNSECVSLWRVLRGHLGSVTCTCELPGSEKNFISGSIDQSIKLWDLNFVNFVSTFSTEDVVLQLSCKSLFEPFLVAFITANRQLNIQDLRQSKSIAKGWPGSLSCDWCCINPNCLISGSVNGSVNYWDLRCGSRKEAALNLPCHRLGVSRVRSLPFHGKIIASAGLDGFIVFSDLQSGRILERVLHHSDYASGMDYNIFNPRLVVDCSWDSLLHVYSPDSLKMLSLNTVKNRL